MIPSRSIWSFKKVSIFRFMRIRSTEHSNKFSKKCFRCAKRISPIGSASIQISTSLVSVCSFLATEPNMRKERIPYSCCNSCLHELIKRMHSSFVFIFLLIYPSTSLKNDSLSRELSALLVITSIHFKIFIRFVFKVTSINVINSLNHDTIIQTPCTY